MTIKALWQSPTVRVAFIFAMAGVSFTVGNLILAREVSTDQFAWITLVITFSQLGLGVAPLGGEILVNRFAVNPDAYLLRRSIFSALAVAAVLTGIAYYFYHFPPALAFVLFVMCAGVGPNMIAGAIYQSRKMFRNSLLVTQVHNAIFLVATVSVFVLPGPAALPVCAIMAVGYVLVPAFVWPVLMREAPRAEALAGRSIPWREGYSLVARGGAVILLTQVERLSIPGLLGTEALATFALLAALIVSPFRMLQRGINYTLLPNLKNARSVAERRQLVRHEALIVGMIVLIASLLIVFFVPMINRELLGNKYPLGYPLIISAIVAGYGKLISSFSMATVLALGSSKDMVRMNGIAWVGLIIAAGAAVIGSRFGLVGLIYGAGIGWYVQFLGALILAVPHLRYQTVPGDES